MILYTVGDPEIYDPIIERSGKIIKTGKRTDYPGGIVYNSVSDALAASKSYGYHVYILETSLDNTYSLGDSLHLINDCDIRKKHAEMGNSH